VILLWDSDFESHKLVKQLCMLVLYESDTPLALNFRKEAQTALNQLFDFDIFFFQCSLEFFVISGLVLDL
jgi:hypothetical protein